KADRLFAGIAASAAGKFFLHRALLNALDLGMRAAQNVLTGGGKSPGGRLAAGRNRPLPVRFVVRAALAPPPGHTAHHNMKATAQSAAFICIGETCSLPVSEPDALAAAVRATRG